MSALRCGLCGHDLADVIVHRPTPELAGPSDRAVFWCVNTKRHVTVATPRISDLRASAGALLRLLGVQSGRWGPGRGL